MNNAILSVILVSMWWTGSLAEISNAEKVDFSQLEFEDLEIDENKDEFLKNLESFEVTYPEALEVDYKLSESHRRLRRDVTDDRASHYQLKAFGKTLDLELQDSESILPGAQVEYHTDSGIETKLLAKNTCFRIGKVSHSKKSSSVALSDCDGLAGLVQTGDDLFFIEPMKSNSSSNHRPHLVYRTKDLPKKMYVGDHKGRQELSPVLEAAMDPSFNSSQNRSSRVRRDVWDSFVTVVNNAQRSVQLHWLDVFGKRRYFVTLGPNQRRLINTYRNTRWVASDEASSSTFLLNGKKEYTAQRNSELNRVEVFVTRPEGLELQPVTSNDVIGDDKWIEALIIADQSVVRFHGKSKVEKYLLVLSNMINQIMKDESIGIRLNFVLTRLVILQKHEPNLVIHATNPSSSVQSACAYSRSLQKSLDDRHEGNHDFALVLTRRNFGPAGYAPVYTMCSSTRSCALVSDNGFPSAFIAAHEAGHVLGLGHDGEENSCIDDRKKGSLMAPLVLSKLSKFYWSSCSRKRMQENVAYFKCLKDRPSAKNFKYLDALPGVFTTMDEQCHHSFGNGHEKCEYYTDGCQRLWCTESRQKYQSCTTKGRPPLDGTFCGKDKWCKGGQCVASKLNTNDPAPIDGNWGAWQQWSKCSLTCGTGLRYRTRKCNNPKPASRGKDCIGSSTDHDVCNTQACRITKNFMDIRSDQCKKIYGREWIYYQSSEFVGHFKDRRYSLECDFQNGLGNWIQDQSDKFDWAIISGRTPSAYTGPQRDTSGSANGKYAFIEASDNIRARRQRGDEARLISPTILLPRGCLKMNYHMYGRDMGALKIKMRSGSKEKVLWEKSGNQGNEWKQLEVSLESVSKYNIVIEAIRGAHYTSDVSIDSIQVDPGLCRKEAEAKNPCMVSCMTKDKKRIVLDTKVFDGLRCHNNKSHDICLSGKCEKFGCDKKFNSDKVLDDCNVCDGDGSSCNAVEGTKNIRPRKDYEKILDLDKDTTNFILEDSVSTPYRIGLRVPGSVEDIFLAAREGHGYFEVGGSTLFYSNLKDGRQMISSAGPFKQPIQAVLYAGSNEVGNSKKKAELRYRYFLKRQDKDILKYEIKGWGECSKRCDGGTQKAILKCVKNEVKEVSEDHCSHLKKNETTRVCNAIPCKSVYKWVILPWTKCSASCGSGRQRRIVACVIRKLNKVVPNRTCPPPYPKNQRNCNQHACVTYRWTINSWGKCSRSCGGGLQVRGTNCVRNTDNARVSPSLCKEKEPVKVQECNLHRCDTFEYRTSSLSKCTKTCGGGLRVRIVNCYNKRTGVRVAKTFCFGPSPPRIQKCNVQLCPVYKWTTGSYGACSQSCDGGTRRRDVSCVEKTSGKRVESSLCTDSKPADSQQCKNPPCSRYFYQVGKWSDCDATCGLGKRNRSILCLMEGSRKEAPLWRCSNVQRPATQMDCQSKACSHPDTLSCDFDQGTFCRWTNSKEDDFDWLIGKSTPTLTTGPSEDHTSRNGNFAYIETSLPRLSRDRAFLSSPALKVRRGCFSFWYHMKGTGMGRLVVKMVGAQDYSKEVFKKERYQGDRWYRANIPIPKDAPNGYQFQIVGEKGNSFLSDIGLDDFNYTSGDCPASCIEKSPLCGVVPIDYCQYSAFMKLCCATCSKRTSS